MRHTQEKRRRTCISLADGAFLSSWSRPLIPCVVSSVLLTEVQFTMSIVCTGSARILLKLLLIDDGCCTDVRQMSSVEAESIKACGYLDCFIRDPFLSHRHIPGRLLLISFLLNLLLLVLLSVRIFPFCAACRVVY